MNNKYVRCIHSIAGSEGTEYLRVDVYDVLQAFSVTCPAIQHAVKKLLCAGIRGNKTKLQDLREAGIAIERSVDLEKQRIKLENANG